MAKNKRPNIVAELGRPETAAETAQRKAYDSKMYKQRKTVNNLVFSLLVTLGLVLIMWLAVPNGGVDTWSKQSVDAVQLAEEAGPSAGRTLAAPATPEGWKAKFAQLRRSGDVTSWNVIYNTPDNGYAAVVQGFTPTGEPVEERWVEDQLEGQQPTGEEELGGVTWQVYDYPDRNPDESNMLFGLRAEIGGDTVLVYGTENAGNLRVLATEVVGSLADSKE